MSAERLSPALQRAAHDAARTLGVWLLVVLLGVFGTLGAAGAATSDPRAEQPASKPVERVALVIGNGNYQHLEALPNPPNDARAMAATLWDQGFEVIEVIDADLGQTLAAMTTFANRLRPGMEALFYYAGHGIQWSGVNFLLPTSADVRHNADLLTQAVDAGAFVRVMERAGARLNIVILDSCRDNPLAEISDGLTPGLAEMRAEQAELMVAYATAPGVVANDGQGRHSPYTQALLNHIGEPGIEIGMLFRRVRAEVRESTGGAQIPWVSSSLESEFYFRPADAPVVQLAALGSAPTDTLGMLPPSLVRDLALWQAVEKSTDPADLKIYLEEFPDGQFAELAKRRLELGPEASSERRRAQADGDPQDPAGSVSIIESFIGIGPVPISFELPAAVLPERLRVRLDQLPSNGRVTLAGAETLFPGDRLTARMLDDLLFYPHSGTRGAAQELRYTVLDGAEERGSGALRIQARLHPCDILGAHPHDPNRVSNGVRIELVNAPAAIAACRRAVEEFPDVPRFAEQLGRSYRAGGDYDDAIIWHRRAAETGYSAAQVSIGKMYRDGLGVPVDDDEAVRWYRLGAEQGDSWGYTALGIMYREGRGVPQDYAEALRLFTDAAQQGNDWAYTNIGRMYVDGLGVPRDYDKAIAWFEKAADMGDLLAQITLGRMYRDGEGVPQDAEQAVRWYRAAAGQGFAHAQARLGRLYEDGQGVEQSYEEALKWYRRAAAQGEEWSHRYIGRLYETGQGVPRDDAEAVRWYRIAAEKGNAWAQRDMGRMYEAGRGLEQDLVEAVRWYARAAGNDDVQARTLSLERLDGMSLEAKQDAAAAMLRQAGWLPAEGGDLAGAIARFQQAHGLPANGELSADLLIALAEQA